MDRSKNIIVWIAGAAGVILLYAAYKGKSPTAVVSQSLGSGASATDTSGVGKAIGANAVPTNDVPGVPSIADGYVYDSNGIQIGTVPSSYAKSPGTYIPGTVNA